MEPADERRLAWDAAVLDMESRSRSLAECSADRNLSWSKVEVSESEPDPMLEAPSEVEASRGGSFSSRVERMWGGWGLPSRGGENALVARLTGMLRSGLGRSSLSDDDERLSVNVGGTGEPSCWDGLPLERKPA